MPACARSWVFYWVRREPSRLVRLGAITAVAIVVIVVARQIGWGMVFGLALFQFVVLASTARTMLKSLRSDA